MSSSELLAWSPHTSGLLCSVSLACPHPTPQQQQVVIWEAPGIAICFQNHRDCNKPYTKHCSVLSWGEPSEEG